MNIRDIIKSEGKKKLLEIILGVVAVCFVTVAGMLLLVGNKPKPIPERVLTAEELAVREFEELKKLIPKDNVSAVERKQELQNLSKYIPAKK